MRSFATLLQQLEVCDERPVHESLLSRYFGTCGAADAPWAIWLLSGKSPKRSANSSSLLSLAAHVSQTPSWLAEECARATDDSAEAAALMLRDGPGLEERGLALWMQVLLSMVELPQDSEEAVTKEDATNLSNEGRSSVISQAWKELSTPERVLFNRLLCGTFRTPVAVTACIGPLSERYQAERALVARRLAGLWDPMSVSIEALFARDSDAVTDPSSPKPFDTPPLLKEKPETLGLAPDWQITRVWGGVPAQLVRRVGESFLWTEAEELITPKVPELFDEARLLPEGTVLAGELVAYSDEVSQPKRVLEQRLKLKRVSKDILRRQPVRFIAHDILESCGEDMQSAPLHIRSAELTKLRSNQELGKSLRFEETSVLEAWEQMEGRLAAVRSSGARGLLLRKRASLYRSLSGTPESFLVLPAARTITAALLYAEKGRGSRLGLFDEFTFAVREGELLVPVAKISDDISGEELSFLQAWIKGHTNERFGPVRSVEPSLLYEIGYESVVASARHRSGLTLIGAHVVRRLTGENAATAHVAQLSELTALSTRMRGGDAL
jgi:DNA ligase-1